MIATSRGCCLHIPQQQQQQQRAVLREQRVYTDVYFIYTYREYTYITLYTVYKKTYRDEKITTTLQRAAEQQRASTTMIDSSLYTHLLCFLLYVYSITYYTVYKNLVVVGGVCVCGSIYFIHIKNIA